MADWTTPSGKTADQVSRSEPERVILKTNLQAFLVWRSCAHQIALGFSAAVPQRLPNAEIDIAARAHKLGLDHGLLNKVRALDDAYVNERIRQVNK